MELHTYQANVSVDLDSMEQCELGKKTIEALPFVLLDDDDKPGGIVKIYNETETQEEPLASRQTFGVGFSVVFAVASVDEAFVEKFLRTEFLDYFKDAPQVWAEVFCIDPEPPSFTIWDYSKAERARIKRENQLIREFREKQRAEWAEQDRKELAARGIP